MVFVLFQICLHGGGGGGGGGCMLLHPTPTCANTGPDLQLKLVLVFFLPLTGPGANTPLA